MSHLIDISGHRFGRLLVTNRSINKKGRSVAWDCRCDCGKEKTVAGASLRHGVTSSCGCLAAELSAARELRHGLSNKPTYYTWSSMIQRTTNPKSTAYPRYGAVGIGCCKEWLVFDNFLADMGIRPEGKTLDRIDNSLGYSKENCKWSTKKEQASNQTTNVVIEHNGKKLTVMEWSRELGIKHQCIYSRLHRGDSPVYALRELS